VEKAKAKVKKAEKKRPNCKHCGQPCDADVEVVVVRLVSGEAWHERCGK
jgi:hypothetical protein